MKYLLIERDNNAPIYIPEDSKDITLKFISGNYKIFSYNNIAAGIDTFYIKAFKYNKTLKEGATIN